MHKIKNKKLYALLLAGFIAITTSTVSYVYANEDEVITPPEVEEKVPEEIKNIVISEINNIENIGLKITTKGTITKIEENKIYIKDDTGEGVVYLKDIVVENLNVEDIVSITGVISELDGANVILVDNIENIVTQTKPEEEVKPEDNGGQTKPTGQGNSNQQNPSSTNSSSEKDEIVINSVKGKSYIIISTDLSEVQWDNVDEALENNLIKVKDIENNKIRITKVDKETGDTIWIVNDPRMLDKEEEETTTSIGLAHK